MTEYVYAESVSGLLLRCKIEPDPVTGLPTIPGGIEPLRDPRWEVANPESLSFQVGDEVTLSDEYVAMHQGGFTTGRVAGIQTWWCDLGYTIDIPGYGLLSVDAWDITLKERQPA